MVKFNWTYKILENRVNISFFGSLTKIYVYWWLYFRNLFWLFILAWIFRTNESHFFRGT